jgi:hypothetical protein
MTVSLNSLGIKSGSGLYSITGGSFYYFATQEPVPATRVPLGFSNQADVTAALDDTVPAPRRRPASQLAQPEPDFNGQQGRQDSNLQPRFWRRVAHASTMAVSSSCAPVSSSTSAGQTAPPTRI